MNVVEYVRYHQGVCRTSRVLEAGHTQRQLAAAVQRGALNRPRRGWVAAYDADPDLVFAARHGVVLSCVTQAKRLGLWTVEEREAHVAAPKPKSRVAWRNGIRHWEQPIITRAPGALQDPLINVLQLVSGCLPREHALTILDSALNRKLTTLAELDRYPLPRRLRELLPAASPFADSGLETLVRDRLRWLRIPIRMQSHVAGHRVDLLIGERLIVQVDGATHTGAQRDIDNLHDGAIQRSGYRVLRFSYAQVMHHWEAVEAAILEAIALGWHLAA